MMCKSAIIRLLTGAITVCAAWAATAYGVVNNPEVEPNESKAAATLCASGGAGMAVDDTISGTTTGTSTVVAGLASADYFIVRTSAKAINFYQYQLVLTTTTPGHTVTIRGLSQAAGIINAGTDFTVQTSIISAPGAPINSRLIQWYGFGRSEQVYVRVMGTAATTAPYSMVLRVATIPPIVVPGPIEEGSITVSRGAANFNNTDFWMYSSALLAIPNYGNDDPASLTRNYTPGTYYIAISNFNVANNQASPADDAFRAGNALDFGDAVVNSSATAALNMDVRVTSNLGAVTAPGTKVNPFDTVLYCFSVIPSTQSMAPTGEGNALPAMADNCGDAQVCLRVSVTPGTNPPSQGLSVTANLNAIGGPTSVPFFDDGQHCDLDSQDLVFGALFTIPAHAPPGPRTISFVVRDQQGRQGEGTFVVNIISCPPAPINDRCGNAIFLPPNGTPMNGTTIAAAADPSAPMCLASDPLSPAVWYRTIGTGRTMKVQTCGSAIPFDTVLEVYCGQGGCNGLSCVASSDDDCGQLTSVAWCSDYAALYYIRVKGFNQYSYGNFEIQVDDGAACNDAAACLPQGACCFGVECVQTSRASCARDGGEYQGDGVECTRLTSRELYRSGNTFPLAIPDNNATGVTSTIVIGPSAVTVGNLVVGVDLVHPWVGDLIIQLSKAGNPNTVTLLERVGRGASGGSGDNSNLDGEYCFAPAGVDSPQSMWAAAAAATDSQRVPPGIYRASRPVDGAPPSVDLNVFSGIPYTGTWTLRVFDRNAGQTGSIRNLTFKLLSYVPTCSPCPNCAADYNGDGGINGDDVPAFFVDWESAAPCSDVNQDGGIDGADVEAFFDVWEAGACG